MTRTWIWQGSYIVRNGLSWLSSLNRGDKSFRWHILWFTAGTYGTSSAKELDITVHPFPEKPV